MAKEFESQQDYENAKHRLIMEFGEAFYREYQYDNLFRAVFETVLRGMSPYDAIKQCILSNANMFKRAKEAIELHSAPKMLYQVPVGYKLVKED